MRLYNGEHYGQTPDDPPGETYELHGNHIVDEASFYCAIGEAVNGPGGYFGASLDALSDCLCGGFGATVPFTLIWHDSDVAREHLTRLMGWEDEQPTYFKSIVDVLQSKGVNTVLR
ncbi:RNAse (barnase) inhibitor barstar [Streptosporangium becharense]|uniref:RNAse (Barnase) inhibitor barstar n=1 Tax=Streptosporangium becharense TaxID=1816182 RepID=A0A7W9IHE2_9ACTN|nr:barstar family protein [Streptosporangium becharense]MBB2912428.1 RNAse (barnase) inhibitor barstar [Streptosporangium becharense]MBB5820743.1 RNAse (barnase) inhibitor barstar [Streptosporangium becharense]